jgi:hypothetical protein
MSDTIGSVHPTGWRDRLLFFADHDKVKAAKNVVRFYIGDG